MRKFHRSEHCGVVASRSTHIGCCGVCPHSLASLFILRSFFLPTRAYDYWFLVLSAAVALQAVVPFCLSSVQESVSAMDICRRRTSAVYDLSHDTAGMVHGLMPAVSNGFTLTMGNSYIGNHIDTLNSQVHFHECFLFFVVVAWY